MYAYSKDLGTLVDLVGAAISNRFREVPIYAEGAQEGGRPIRVDQQYVDTQVIGFGFGCNLPLVNVESEEIGMALGADIAKAIKDEEGFYDVRQRLEQLMKNR